MNDNDEIESKSLIYLKSANGSALETQVGLEILSDFSHQTLKGQLPDQQFRGFLVATNFQKNKIQSFLGYQNYGEGKAVQQLWY